MKTFNAQKKAEVVAIAKQHQEADRFMQGAWIQESQGKDDQGLYKGCFHGCFTQTDNNTLRTASEENNIPLWIIYVSECIFEGLEEHEALTFPLEFYEAMPCDNDLDKVWREWNKAVLSDQLRFVEDGSPQELAIKQCIYLFDMDVITESAARSAHFLFLKNEIIRILNANK